MRNNRFLIFIILLVCSAGVYGQTKVGTSAANFLQIGVGSRNISLGDAGVASFGDVSAAYWNPALLAFSSRSQAYFSHINWFAEIGLNYGSFVLNAGNVGNFAVSLYSLGTDQMEVTTEDYQNGTGELFSVQDLMAGLSYARALTDRFNIGGTVKLIRSTIWNTSATTFAVDAGLTFQLPFNPFGWFLATLGGPNSLRAATLGMSISNFGGEMRMLGTDTAVRYDPDLMSGGNNDGIVSDQHTRSWDLPILFRVGLAYPLFDSKQHELLVVSDVLYPSTNENYVNAGLEYNLQNRYFLRGGFRQLALEDREGGLTLGAGVNVYNLKIDYAYSDRGRLNDVQYFSIGVNF